MCQAVARGRRDGPFPCRESADSSRVKEDQTACKGGVRPGGPQVFAKLNHVAIVSENYAQLSQVLRGDVRHDDLLQDASCTRGHGARRLCRAEHQPAPRRAFGDLRPFRHPGRGYRDRVRPHAQVLSDSEVAASGRPTGPSPASPRTIPTATCSTSRRRTWPTAATSMSRTTARLNPRHIDHFAMRTMNAEAMAEFYSRVFELTPTNRREGDKNFYLSDGHVTLVIMPWDITDYDGTGIITCGMDHIGFKVENLNACKEDIARIADDNPRLAPAPGRHRPGRRRSGETVRTLLPARPAPACGLRRHPDRHPRLISREKRHEAFSDPGFGIGCRRGGRAGPVARLRSHARGVLQRPADDAHHERGCRRRLCHLRKRIRALSVRAHPRQAAHHRAVHAGRRGLARDQLSLQQRAQRRFGHRHGALQRAVRAALWPVRRAL